MIASKVLLHERTTVVTSVALFRVILQGLQGNCIYGKSCLNHAGLQRRNPGIQKNSSLLPEREAMIKVPGVQGRRYFIPVSTLL